MTRILAALITSFLLFSACGGGASEHPATRSQPEQAPTQAPPVAEGDTCPFVLPEDFSRAMTYIDYRPDGVVPDGPSTVDGSPTVRWAYPEDHAADPTGERIIGAVFEYEGEAEAAVRIEVPLCATQQAIDAFEDSE